MGYPFTARESAALDRYLTTPPDEDDREIEWECTYEDDCDCPECQLAIKNGEEEDEYNRLLDTVERSEHE